MGDWTSQFYDELLISHYKDPYFHQPVEWHVEVLSETGPFMNHFYPKNPSPPPMKTPNPKQVVSRPHDIPKILTHRIHVWYIYLHLPSKSTIHVGKYTSPMDPMGLGRAFWEFSQS